jgi:hypothetical protein
MTQTISNQRIEEFLSSKGKFVLYIVLGLGILVFALYRFFVPSTDNSLKQYLDAKIQVQKLSYEKESNQEVLKELQNSPLAKENQGVIAQNLAFQGKWDEVHPMAQKSMDNFLTKDSPYYDYSAISFLIEKNDIESAIKESLLLQKNIESESAFAILSLYNIVRLNVLSQFASLEDRQTISLMSQNFLNDPNNIQYLNQVEELFKEGNSTLGDFLKLTK